MKLTQTQKKVLLFLIVVFLNSFGYIGAQILRPDGVSLQTSIDNLIPFIPEFVVAYALYLPIALIPFAVYWSDYKKYKIMALSIAAVFIISILVFLVFQTSVVRPPVNPSDGFFHWAVSIVYSLDKPVNAFPSLHVAVPTIATLFVYLRNKKLGLYIAPITIAIILSTVFIKQHYALDIAGGLILALFVFRYRINFP